MSDWASASSGSISSSRASRYSFRSLAGASGSISQNNKGDALPNTLIHLNVKDIDAVSAEFGIPVDEEGLAERKCDLEDPDGNRLRVATPRS